MIQPLKLGPMRAAEYSNLVSTHREPNGKHIAIGGEAHSVVPWLGLRAPTINELYAQRIPEAFNRLCKRAAMLANVFQLFVRVPLKIHQRPLPYKYGFNTFHDGEFLGNRQIKKDQKARKTSEPAGETNVQKYTVISCFNYTL